MSDPIELRALLDELEAAKQPIELPPRRWQFWRTPPRPHTVALLPAIRRAIEKLERDA